MSVLPPPVLIRVPQPVQPMPVALVVVMWIAWLGVMVVADFLGFLMFAFADSPGSASTVQLMIVPVFVWFGVTFVAGIVLLILKRWWTILLAFVLAASPPFVVFAGYNVLDGAGRAANAAPAGPPVPTQIIKMPPGGFSPNVAPPRPLPDFRSYYPSPTTQPRPTTRGDD